MNTNGNEEVSLLDLDQRIKELKSLNVSLRREIDQNQLEAINLRESLKALFDKELIKKDEIKVLEATILTRRNEISSIDTLIDKERRIIEHEKRDLIAKREGIEGEMLVFRKEKQGALEGIEDTRKKLVREQVDNSNLTQELRDREKEIKGQLDELSARRVKMQELEVKNQAKASELDKQRDEIEVIKRLTEKALDEANAKSIYFDSLSAETREKLRGIDEREATVKVAMNDIEARQQAIKSDERDIIIEKDKLRSIRTGLLKEAEMARIDQTKKDKIKKEIEAKVE